MSILREANVLPAAIEHKDGVPGQNVDFESNGCFVQLYDLFQNSGVRGMIEGKDYCPLDMVLPSTGAYIERAIGFQNHASMNGALRRYSDINSKVVSQNNGQE